MSATGNGFPAFGNASGPAYVSASAPTMLPSYASHTPYNIFPPAPEDRRLQAQGNADWRFKRLHERLSIAPINGFASGQRSNFDSIQERVAQLREQQQRLFLEQFQRYPAVQGDARGFASGSAQADNPNIDDPVSTTLSTDTIPLNESLTRLCNAVGGTMNPASSSSSSSSSSSASSSSSSSSAADGNDNQHSGGGGTGNIMLNSNNNSSVNRGAGG